MIFSNKKNKFCNNTDSNNKDTFNDKHKMMCEQLLVHELDSYIQYEHNFSDKYNERKQAFVEELEHEDTNENINIRKNTVNKFKKYDKGNKKRRDNKNIYRILAGRNNRIAAAVILAIIIVPGCVIAAEKVVNYYNVNIKKTGNFGYDVGLERINQYNDKEDYSDNDKFHTSVKININKEMKDYSCETDGTNYKYEYTGITNNEAKDIAIMLIGLNKDEDIRIRYVTNLKETEYEDKRVLWFTHNYDSFDMNINTSRSSYVNDVFIVYSNYGYAIEIKSQKDVSQELMEELITSVELIECSESEAAHANYRIYRDEFKEGEENDDIYAGEYNDVSYALNDKFNMLDVDMYSSNKLQFTITGYQVFDSVKDVNNMGFQLYTDNYNDISGDSYNSSNWTNSEFIREITNEDGAFIKYKRPKTHNMGNGIDTLNSIYEVDDVKIKLVLVDINVTNTSNDYVKNVRLIPQICSLYKDAGKYMIPKEYYSNSLVNSEGYPICFMFDSSLGVKRNGGDCNRTDVKPDENIHITVGYLVDEDRLDNMLLFYNSYGNLTYSGGKIAYIRLE